MTDDNDILSVPDFAKSIREQYGAYDDWDDMELTNSVLAKYPEFSSRVAMPVDDPPAKPKPVKRKDRYSQAEMEDILRQAGWDEKHIPTMSAIGMAESSGKAGAYNPGRRGQRLPEQSIGLWQINMDPSLGRRYDRKRLAEDPIYNATVAKEIYGQQGLKAWGAYTDKRYQKYFKGKALPSTGATMDLTGPAGETVAEVYAPGIPEPEEGPFGTPGEQAAYQAWKNRVTGPPRLGQMAQEEAAKLLMGQVEPTPPNASPAELDYTNAPWARGDRPRQQLMPALPGQQQQVPQQLAPGQPQMDQMPVSQTPDESYQEYLNFAKTEKTPPLTREQFDAQVAAADTRMKADPNLGQAQATGYQTQLTPEQQQEIQQNPNPVPIAGRRQFGAGDTISTSFPRQTGRPKVDLAAQIGVTDLNPKMKSIDKMRVASQAQLSRYGVTPQEIETWLRSPRGRSELARISKDPTYNQIGVQFSVLSDIKGKEYAENAIATEQSMDQAKVAGSTPAPAMLTQNELARIDKGIINTFGPGVGSLAAGALRSGGTAWSVIGGAVRPLVGGEGGLYETAKSINEATARLEEIAGDDSWQSGVLKFVGGLPGDLARLYLLTRVGGPAAAIVGFAADSGLRASGEGKSKTDVALQTLKGGIIGSIFSPVSNWIGGAAKLHAARVGAVRSTTGLNIVKQGFQTGAIAGGTAVTEQAFGASEEDAWKAAGLNALFHVANVGGRAGLEAWRNRNVRIRSWDGNEALVVIDKDGNIREPDVTSQPPPGGGTGRSISKEDAWVEAKMEEAKAQGIARPDGTALREQFRRENPQAVTEAAPAVKPDVEVYVPQRATLIPVDLMGFRSGPGPNVRAIAPVIESVFKEELDLPDADLAPEQITQHVQTLERKLAEVNQAASELKNPSPRETKVVDFMRQRVEGALAHARGVEAKAIETTRSIQAAGLEAAAQPQAPGTPIVQPPPATPVAETPEQTQTRIQGIVDSLPPRTPGGPLAQPGPVGAPTTTQQPAQPTLFEEPSRADMTPEQRVAKDISDYGTSFTLPLVTRVSDLKRTLSFTDTTKSGRTIKRSETVQKRQDRINKQYKVITKVMDCLNGKNN